ncbi:MAG: hypothetical protein BGP16_00900 [Sphingobium sp. 66-54]|nr:MAG: hypothetical protein BGP16_00900 [Sphingobium sp. 66-54]
MKKLPVAAEKLLRKLGEPVVIDWPAASFNDLNDSTTLKTFAVIEDRLADRGKGYLEMSSVAMLPRLSRDLSGATLTVRGTTYSIQKYTQTLAAGNVAVQEVILT